MSGCTYYIVSHKFVYIIKMEIVLSRSSFVNDIPNGIQMMNACIYMCVQAYYKILTYS